MNFSSAELAAQSASSRPVSPASAAVSRVGRFYVLRELGCGTTACVYLAHDPLIGRDIAVKVLHPQLAPTERAKYERQFINEARAAGLLAHPNIITIHDACIEHDAPYIAMEYLQGSELEQMMANGHRFKADEVATIIRGLADALDHAHRRQVIHRDVKPANIFMLREGRPKLVDFGIAQAPNHIASGGKEDSHRYDVAGTPNYMSPEQALGRHVDARTDIYSLGAVMYELLAHRKPFQSDDADELLHLVASKTPCAPNELDPRVPIVLSDIAMKAMHRRPEHRYQTAQQMALDLKRYLAGERHARRRMRVRVPGMDSTGARERKQARRTLYWVGGCYVAVAAIVAAVALFA